MVLPAEESVEGRTATPLFQLASVTKSFGAVRALKAVSFDLRAGEVHALLGENGAGKSTLIKIITGAHQPDGGAIHVNGERVPHLTPAAAHQLGVACIYQQPALFPDLTVAENIGLRLESVSTLRRVNWPSRRQRAAQLLQRIGANISPEAEVRSLSMPEQQLVEIACALGAGARIVIMDEPTASLTQQEVELLFAVVRELRASGVGIVYITHRLEEIFALADRVTVLRDGESVGTRTVRQPFSPHPGPLPMSEGETQPVSRNDERGSCVSAPEPIPPLPQGEDLPNRDSRFESLNPGAPASSPALGVRLSKAGEGPSDPVHGKGKQRVPQSSAPVFLPPAVNEAELIRMMVGRDVSQVFPPSQSTPGEVVLALQNLGCSFSGVRDVTLEIRAGEIVGLAGLVGAGRTELARVLFGITPADSGQLMLDGRRIAIRSPQQAMARGLAYVPEDRRRHGVILDMPVAQNMTMAIHRRLFPRAWLHAGAERRVAQEFIHDLRIKTDGAEAPAHSLSGGNQQKVSLARWLATKPRVLILDEPTQGVDVGAKSEIYKIIRSLAKQGLAVLMISSDLPEILGLSDRIAVMRGGTVVATLPGKSDAQQIMSAALGQNLELDRGESKR